MSQNTSTSLYSVNSESLNEWFGILVRQNSERIKNAVALSTPKGQFYRDTFVESIFSICREHQLPREVWYLAAELFEDFMQRHLSELHEYVKKNTTNKKAQGQWVKVVSRIKNQTTLRLISCCQIASKFVSNYKNLGCRMIISQLRKLGHKFNEEGINKSEMRVLKTIRFKVVHPTPLVYIDLFLAKLGECKEFKDKLWEYRNICLDILDVLLVDKQSIYQSFAEVVSSSQINSQSERCAIYAIENDYMFMAASVIAASSFIADQSSSDWVLEAVSEISKIDSSDIVNMSSVLLKPFAQASVDADQRH